MVAANIANMNEAACSKLRIAQLAAGGGHAERVAPHCR